MLRFSTSSDHPSTDLIAARYTEPELTLSNALPLGMTENSSCKLKKAGQRAERQLPPSHTSAPFTRCRFSVLAMAIALCTPIIIGWSQPSMALALSSTRNVAAQSAAANAAAGTSTDEPTAPNAPEAQGTNAPVNADTTNVNATTAHSFTEPNQTQPSVFEPLPQVNVESSNSFTHEQGPNAHFLAAASTQPVDNIPTSRNTAREAEAAAAAIEAQVAAMEQGQPLPEAQDNKAQASTPDDQTHPQGNHVLSREEIRSNTTKCEAERDMEACNALGMHYLILAIDHGLDVELNMRLAAHNLEQACAGGIKSACGFWANALGMYGNYFISELNPKPDYTKGRMFLEQSCQQKDPYGCAQLGTLYVSGKGVTQNVTQGLQLFALSCKLANSIPDEFIQVDNNIGLGCFYLGQSYLDNKTLDPNGDQAIGYLNQACDLQAAPACSLLANYYQQHGAIDSAHLYREKACYAGMTEECVNEAVFYHHVGNETEANRLLQVGCELNNDNACTLLASNLLYGIGIQQNVPQALTLVRQACNHNSALACFYLAQLYHTGITNVPDYQLPRNLDIAHDLYLKSCNLGNDLSCIELQKLEQLIAPQPKP